MVKILNSNTMEMFLASFVGSFIGATGYDVLNKKEISWKANLTISFLGGCFGVILNLLTN